MGEGGGARFVQVGGVVALVADGLEHGGGWAFEPSEAGVEDGLLDFIEIAAAEAIFKVVHFGARHHAERDHVDLLLPAPTEVIHEGRKVRGRKGSTGKIAGVGLEYLWERYDWSDLMHSGPPPRRVQNATLKARYLLKGFS